MTVEVTTRIAHGDSPMIRRVASTPSIPGMNRSIRIRSGRSTRARAIASAPSLAVQATSCSDDDSTTRRNASRARPVSLTIPILMKGDFDSSDQPIESVTVYKKP